jgi:hypothetical protein
MIIAFILITTLRSINLIRLSIFSLYRAVNTPRFGHGNWSYREIITVCSDSHTKQMDIRTLRRKCGIFVRKICEKRLLASSCVCLSVRKEKLGYNWTDFREF